MGTSRGEVPSESASVVRIGPDAWQWLTAADRSGRVGGRFRGGVNAVFGSEALVCFQSQSVPIHPWALVADLAWEEVEEGAPVTVSRAKLSVGRFALPLEEAEVVDLTFHPPEHLVSLKELHERVALIEQLLAETPDPFESEFDRAFVRDRDRILAEWQETGAPEVLLELIGRGPGTTPAGDDTLIGLLAGLEVLAAVAPGLAASRLQATRHVPRASPPTSLLSAQVLTSAAAGRFPSTLLELEFAILDPAASPTHLVGAVSAALATGQTTGKAALDGLAAGLIGFRGILAGQPRTICHRKT
ncbi:MAG: DUF2877 domain-containing protein [Candidatus Bipolaricaulota bacterium]|nr:DUF2877 domain-containing protein [Candidatus Bipolaricaulota bacterium]